MQQVLDYKVEPSVDQDRKPCIAAYLTHRPSIVCIGADEHEALASLFYQSCWASWSRHFNPDCPGLCQGMDSNPIQQAISLLTTALDGFVKDREGIVLRNLNEPNMKVAGDPADMARLNELIGNVATAISALSRIKSS